MCIFPYLSIYVPILAIPSVKSSFGAPPVISNVCPNFLDDVSLRVGSSGLSVLKYIGFSAVVFNSSPSFLATEYNWEPLIPSVLVAEISPGAICFNWRSLPSLPKETILPSSTFVAPAKPP